MHNKQSYFFSHGTSIQILIYAAVMLGLWILELCILMPSFKEKWTHTANNILFIATALPVQLFMSVFVLAESAWLLRGHLGLLNMIPFSNSIVVKYLLGFILLDLCEYLYHVIMHKTKPLWKLHIVHHTDQQLDVSSTVREHPGETFVRMCFLMVWVLLLGASFQLLLLRQTLQTIVNVTSHTSFRLSEKADRLIGLVLVTPNIHHVHHHYRLPHTDCNYGDVLSIWDRIFGTYGKLELKNTTFGIDTCMDETTCNSFLQVLKVPFRK